MGENIQARAGKNPHPFFDYSAVRKAKGVEGYIVPLATGVNVLPGIGEGDTAKRFPSAAAGDPLAVVVVTNLTGAPVDVRYLYTLAGRPQTVLAAGNTFASPPAARVETIASGTSASLSLFEFLFVGGYLPPGTELAIEVQTAAIGAGDGLYVSYGLSQASEAFQEYAEYEFATTQWKTIFEGEEGYTKRFTPGNYPTQLTAINPNGTDVQFRFRLIDSDNTVIFSLDSTDNTVEAEVLRAGIDPLVTAIVGGQRIEASLIAAAAQPVVLIVNGSLVDAPPASPGGPGAF